MKKFYLVLLLLVTCSSSFASYTMVTQSNWRWRNSDGTQTSATWKAPQGVATGYNSIHEVIRVRIELINNSRRENGLARGNESQDVVPASITPIDTLQYSTSIADETSWKNITNNAARAFVMAGTAPYVVQGEATTSQIMGTPNNYSAGKMMVNDTVLKNITIVKSGRTEIEWAIIGTPNLLPNTTYYFRSRGTTRYYTSYPTLTTGSTLPIKLSGFTAISEGKKVKIAWSTASEENNDYFSIQRSTDGRTWTAINKVPGKGTSSLTSYYTAYDYGPPSTGTVYYRLLQYDKDGKYSTSEIRSVKMFLTNKPVVSVLPNPAKSGISFKLENTSARDVQATLTDVNGRIIHAQVFKNVEAGNLNRLNLNQQPAPGIYILKLKGDGLSESVKVVVQ